MGMVLWSSFKLGLKGPANLGGRFSVLRWGTSGRVNITAESLEGAPNQQTWRLRQTREPEGQQLVYVVSWPRPQLPQGGRRSESSSKTTDHLQFVQQ